MDLVTSLLQRGLLERALDLAISESFFNSKSPDDIKHALKAGLILMLLTVTATMLFLAVEPLKHWIFYSAMKLMHTILTSRDKMLSFIKKIPKY
ncbi:hypothetical protein ACS6IR_20670 [Enterobacter hormaechei subsp. hoffmannii]|uniref:hypothetical protein n=1 Tax=Enterobacter hormaechei TaxID=158836 RepID=UPI0038C0CFDF